MRPIAALTLAALAAGCSPPVVTNLNDGYYHIANEGNFTCDGRPVSIDRNHGDVELRRNCRVVRVLGSHIDVVAYVQPGASFELDGSHDTIVWRQVRPGPPPTLADRGVENDFDKNSRAPWERSREWWQDHPETSRD